LPGAPTINFFDYYYHPHQHDLCADLLLSLPPEYYYWRRTTNAMSLLELENGTHAWTATAWQRSLFPREYQDDFLVLHPGVNTARFHPDLAWPRSLDGQRLSDAARVVSFIASSLDRVRGFDRFVQLADRLQADDPDVVCVAVGDFTVGRGLDVDYFGTDYAHQLLQMTPVHDRQRLWLLGGVPPAVVANVLAASDLHVYPSRAYPVSTSLLEAMACGCPVLAWDSPPVREVLSHGENGLIVPSDDLDAAVAQAQAVLADPAEYAPLGRAAAELIRQHYAHDVTVPALARHFDSLLTASR
jgi:glycosyltransferase involved in cell wall biosynthesis